MGKKRTVTPEKVNEILKNHGTSVTLEEAELVLDLAYNLTHIAVQQLKRKSSQNGDV